MAESLFEKPDLGSTGHQPVPSRDSPDGRERAFPVKLDAGFVAGIAPLLFGGSPTEAGESSAPPISKTGSEELHGARLPVLARVKPGAELNKRRRCFHTAARIALTLTPLPERETIRPMEQGGMEKQALVAGFVHVIGLGRIRLSQYQSLLPNTCSVSSIRSMFGGVMKIQHLQSSAAENRSHRSESDRI